MDKLKSAVGLGGKSEEGQEPVSAEKGEGTATEPFDAGNKQEATETADKTEDASELSEEHAYLGSAIDADEARATDESKSEPAPPSTSTAEEEKPKEEKKSGGGFFKAIGLGGGKKKDEEQTQAGADKIPNDSEAETQKLPPNHLGSAVPEGASKDLADPGTVAPGQTDGIAASKDTSAGAAAPQVSEPAADETPRSPSTSAGKQPDRGGSVGSSGLSPDRARSTGGSSATMLPGSRGEHRGSMIPADAPKYKRVENPDRIPTAGGKRIGEEQYQTRRASMAPPSPPKDMAKLDREGSPDAVTASNTEANTAPAPSAPIPEAKNTAPQQMKEFSMGDASEKAEAKPVSSGPPEGVAPDEGPKAAPAETTTTESSSTGGAVGAAKEKLTPGGGKENASGGGHTRRGSVFDRLKEKMKGGKSKS